MYYDEDVLLEFRLNYLNSYVDKFVIIECGYSHRGIKKKFNFNINKFKSFKEKIIYIKVKHKPNNLNIIVCYGNKIKLGDHIKIITKSIFYNLFS